MPGVASRVSVWSWSPEPPAEPAAVAEAAAAGPRRRAPIRPPRPIAQPALREADASLAEPPLVRRRLDPGPPLPSVTRRRTPPRCLRPKRLLAPAALVFAIVVVVAIVADRDRARGRQQSTTRAPCATTTVQAGDRHDHHPGHRDHHDSTATIAPTPPPTPVSLTLAAQLESQGHDLLTDGQASAAVPILKRAMAATGEDVSACVEPDSTMCLTYAYALYDLGRALRLSGDPTAAVPILEAPAPDR